MQNINDNDNKDIIIDFINTFILKYHDPVEFVKQINLVFDIRKITEKEK